MSIITNKDVAIFDLSAIHRWDCIRIRRANDATHRNGIITKLAESDMEILYSNTQSNATSFMQVKAGDVAIGVWEIYWTTDFTTVNYQSAADGGNTGA